MILVPWAFAAHTTLILVGDTGEDNAVARVVSAAVAAELADPRAVVLALGDLYYDAPPATPDCAGQVAERYRAFYGPFADRVYAVPGNHDFMSATSDTYDPASRACTAAAFAKLGWTGPETRLVALDAGRVQVDLVLLDAGYYGAGATPPVGIPFREEADWRIYADHYGWRTGSEKCGEADKIPVTWLGAPPMDLWLNGHAHHLGAVAVGPVEALTSGGGMQLRPLSACAGVEPHFLYTGEAGKARGGYLRLELLSPKKARITPVLCEGEQCAEEPAWVCRRRGDTDDGRGVSCAPA